MKKIEEILSLCKAKGVELLAFHHDLESGVIIVLCRRISDSTYISWNVFETAQTPQGVCFEHGHYLTDMKRAFSDFYKRVEEQSNGILSHYETSVLAENLEKRVSSLKHDNVRFFSAFQSYGWTEEELEELDEKMIGETVSYDGFIQCVVVNVSFLEETDEQLLDDDIRSKVDETLKLAKEIGFPRVELILG
ncbi:hypothetical protein ADMFC3_27610 [Geovibrio sp. ADMFC3]